MRHCARRRWRMGLSPESVALWLASLCALAAATDAGAQTAASQTAAGPTTRRVRVLPRHSHPFHSDTFVDARGERIFVFRGGINLLVEDLATGDVVDIVADRAVLWTRGGLSGEIAGSGASTDGQRPLEAYLEGNVFVRGGRLRTGPGPATQSAVLAGKQVYANLTENQMFALDGSVETFDPQLRLPLFARSVELRQLDRDHFFGEESSVTTSPYRGTPGYDFSARELYLERFEDPIENPLTGAPILDPQSGQPAIRTRYFATTYGNVLRVGGVPVFYWPYLRLDVEDPLGPLEDFSFGHSQNLGVATTLGLDLWQLSGFDYLPIAEHSNWLLDVGYYSKRGPAGGTRFEYFGAGGLPGLDGPFEGELRSWWIDDHGRDILGRDPSRQFTPPREFRGRFRAEHRHRLPGDVTLRTGVSYLSDSHILESFFENEYDFGRDQETYVYLKQARNDWGWTALVQPRLHSFLPQNPWLPRLDGYLLGRPLLSDRLTYFGHASVGWGLLRPPDEFILPTDRSLDTVRADMRHELDLPLSLGPWEVTPFVVGQLTGYSRTLTSQDGVGRLYGAAGVRTSLPIWRVYRGVHSDLFNVDGIAHRINVNVDYLLARSNRDFRALPTLDQPDDDTSELVRRQNLLRQFGTVPLAFDPRFFALRNNVDWLPDIQDDMHNVRLGLVQRLQTKRGPVGEQRIIDWMVLDVGMSLFPQRDQDNFGEYLGLIDYAYEWHLGDRTALTSAMLADPHNDTIAINGAMHFQRPSRATYSLFYSHFDAGPFQSNYMGLASTYRFSEKYAGAISVGRDLEAPDSFSYDFEFTRLGLDFITSLGIVYNSGRDDFGLQFSILPRIQAAGSVAFSRLRSLPFGLAPGVEPAPVAQDRMGFVAPGY